MHPRGLPPIFHRSPISIVATAAARSPPPRRPLPRSIYPLGLGLSVSYALFPSFNPTRFDSGSPGGPFLTGTSSSTGGGGRSYSSSSGGGSGRGKGDGPLGLDAQTMRQITTGSILGLVGGLAFSMFSRTLTILAGLGLIVTQYLASKGIRLIPVETIQKYVKSVDVRKLVESNPALKISFGLTFMLAAFGSF